MHRAVMQACLPWFVWLCVAGGLAFLLAQYCGGRPDWRRLRRLSSCEDGAIQSLSLVLTLPIFLMLVLFIVQISQIMIGVMMVHYAAFAGGRAASVWIPADVTTDPSFQDPPFDLISMLELLEQLNGLPPNSLHKPVPVPIRGSSDLGLLEPANILAGNIDGRALPEGGFATMNAANGGSSTKYQRILMAAVVPCLTISPSRGTDSLGDLPAPYKKTYQVLFKIYSKIDPKSKSNTQIPVRLRNKLNYAARFTTVDLTWQSVAHPVPDIVAGPTYNPYWHPSPRMPHWRPNEVGFRDPVTVRVRHQFALLPGIGRVLAKFVASDDGPKSPASPEEDRVAGRIKHRTIGGTELYTIELAASATFVNEGFKSVFRYAVQP